MTIRQAGWFRWKSLGFEIPGFLHVEKITESLFSTIYRAYQPQFGRRVAIKVLDAKLSGPFKRECETLGKLGDHPHVVKVFHADISKSGTPYIVMEYLAAGSFADQLNAGGPLPWDQVLPIGVKLAGVLQSAHEAGILHLDVKPANVLIGPDGEPKLADFGIARLRAELEYSTQTLGFTPGYGAPELFEEGAPAVASDVFGLGSTLFALIKGHSPFLRSRHEQPSVSLVIGRMLFGPTPKLNPTIPQDVRAVVRRAMAISPRDRFGSAAELGEALRTVQRNHGLAATPLLVVPVAQVPPAPSPPRPRRWRMATASLLLALTPIADAVRAGASPEACVQADTVQADGVLSFGMVSPKRGQFNFQGPAMQAGAQLAINDVNAAGAIPGIAVQLDPANQLDEGDPSTDTVKQATDTLLARDVDVIIGPALSASTAKVIDHVTCAGVILFSPVNGAALFATYPDHGLYFRTSPSDMFRVPILAALIVADGNRTVVVMARDDVWGNGLRQATTIAIENAGVSVLGSFSYNPNAPNFNREVQRVKAHNPDAIVLIGVTESDVILRAMTEQNLGPNNKKVYGTSNVTSTLARRVNPENPGVLSGMKGVAFDDGDDAFKTRLRQINPGLQDFRYGTSAYDAVVITALAAALAGTDAPAAVAAQTNDVTKDGVKCTNYADCLRLIQADIDIDYDGATGPLDFTEPGEPSSATYAISEIQADGSLKLLDTTTVTTP